AQANKKLPPAATDPKFAKSVWAKNTTIAEKYNEPGRFTAFIGYEWTSNAGGGDNLHRNLIYRDNKDKADQVLPMTTFQTQNPEDLWKWMTAWEHKTGGKLLAIPHSGNVSGGRMCVLTVFNGDPMTRAWAEERSKWEPLFEVAQIKGQSEAHPRLAPNDEFIAGYELWDKGNLILELGRRSAASGSRSSRSRRSRARARRIPAWRRTTSSSRATSSGTRVTSSS